MPLLPGDDYLYSLKIPAVGHIGESTIKSLGDYTQSQINHYKNYNYRVTPHAALQCVLLLPSGLFKLANTLVFLAIPFVMLRPFRQRLKTDQLGIYFFILMLIWCFHFDLGRAYFWTSGSLNYTWMLIPQLLLLGSFYTYYTKAKGVSKMDIGLATLVAFSNENAVFALAICSLLILLKDIRSKRDFQWPLFITTTILFVGGATMLFSPSLVSRLLIVDSGFDEPFSKLVEYLKRQGYYILRFIPLLFIYFLFKSARIRFNIGKPFMIVVFLSSVVMYSAPLYEPRSAIFPFTIFGMYLLSTIIKYEKVNNWPFVLLITFSLVLFIERYPLFDKVYNTAKENEIILSSNRNSRDTVYLNKYCDASKFNCLICDEISDDPQYIDNEPLAAYYNIHKVALKKEQSLVQKYNAFKKTVESGQYESGNSIPINKKLTETIFLESVIHKRDESGLSQIYRLISDDKISNDIIVSLRASRTNMIRHRLYDFLPLKVRHYFLDYLEHHGKIISSDKVAFGFNHIYNPEDYKYCIIRLYSLNNHTPIGQPVVLEF